MREPELFRGDMKDGVLLRPTVTSAAVLVCACPAGVGELPGAGAVAERRRKRFAPDGEGPTSLQAICNRLQLNRQQAILYI